VTTIAYIFIAATVVFFVGIFAINKERDGEGSYVVITLAVLTMAITGVGLALHVIGINPRVTL